MFNPFKKKSKPVRAPAAPKSRPSAAVEPAPAAAAERPKAEPLDPSTAFRAGAARGKRRIIGVLAQPHLTEKSNAAASHRWYTFRVAPEANKILIRKAVEDRYGVSVEAVRILGARPKKIRLGRIEGRTPGFKKAMVKLRQGQSIEFT